MNEPDRFDNIVSVLANFLRRHNAIYIKCEPEIIDFRKNYEGNIILYGKGDESVEFNIPNNDFPSFVGVLTAGLFSGDKLLFTWDIKRLFSYLYHRLNRRYVINVLARIIDIKYGEAFLGISGVVPNSFAEAKERAIIARNDALWNIHHRIHIPLATKTIPKIETSGILDTESRLIRYSVYDIEGEINGRLRCGQPFKDSLLAHTLTQEQKIRLCPRPSVGQVIEDHVFMVLDFKAMEMFQIQWLSKDERLGRIVTSGRDMYSTVYSLLYGHKCTPAGRQLIKDSFLPIVYGMQSESLAARLNITREDAATLIKKIDNFFKTAMDWVRSAQDKAKEGLVADYFGRPRTYDGNEYVARNAVVQGPAAIVCLEKLIILQEQLAEYCEVVASIHDAYVLDVPRRILYDVAFMAQEILQSPSTMCPGLTLRVDINIGKNLHEMENYEFFKGTLVSHVS